MSKVNVLRVSNLVAIILTLIMNGLSNSDIFPATIGDLAESRATIFLPAGYVFAIWGLIYTLAIGFVIYSFRPRAEEDGTVETVGWWFVISCIANVSWLILWLYEQVWLSTVAMLVLLAALLMIYTKLGIGERKVDWQQRWATFVPFSVYLGWISVATVANFTAALYDTGAVTTFLGIGADMWTVIMMAVAAVLGFAMLYFRKDVAYALVIVWAVYGINARPFDTELYSIVQSLNLSFVNTAALAIAVIVAIGALAQFGISAQKRFA